MVVFLAYQASGYLATLTLLWAGWTIIRSLWKADSAINRIPQRIMVGAAVSAVFYALSKLAIKHESVALGVCVGVVLMALMLHELTSSSILEDLKETLTIRRQ